MGNVTHTRRFSIRQSLKYHFIEKKMNTVSGYLFLAVFALAIAYGTALIDYKIGLAFIALCFGIITLLVIMRWPYFGFYFTIAFASIVITIDRITQVPVPSGNLVEIFSYLCLLSILLKYDLKKNINVRFYANPITVCIYFLFAYYMVELFNPEMFSSIGWISFFRKQFSYFVFYYMCYCLLDSKKRIIYFIRFMIGLTTVLALYACKQQMFGYAGFELRWIGTGAGYALLMQGGLLRKFSVFSDPATSGILFTSITLLCVIILFRSKNKKERYWLGAATMINLLGYSFSGTRTATLMIIAGIVFYCISAIYERRTMIFLGYSALVFITLMVMPFQNVVTGRIRSTFEGTKDRSAAIRDYDRKEVQPYIQAHPLGGGIFTSGGEGSKYNRGHYLEYLQADSGYMKNVAEQGPIGFFFLLAFYFVVMRVGFRSFYRVNDPEIRTYYIGLLVMIFSLFVAQYSQMAIAQYPVVLYFYATMVIFIKLADFDTKVQPENTKQL
jgi:putative inorganic carbon (hco3(-)) transporter